ncbi:hypothetical protein GCM10007908_03300 [Rhizobium albus]|nr:hypothetical protein GCM10007908_03300 [Rhizobium albus]
MTPITLPTIPCTRLEADRAARNLLTDAGWAPRALVILIAAAAAVACIGFGIEALVADHARWVAEARV